MHCDKQRALAHLCLMYDAQHHWARQVMLRKFVWNCFLLSNYVMSHDPTWNDTTGCWPQGSGRDIQVQETTFRFLEQQTREGLAQEWITSALCNSQEKAKNKDDIPHWYILIDICILYMTTQQEFCYDCMDDQQQHHKQKEEGNVPS